METNQQRWLSGDGCRVQSAMLAERRFDENQSEKVWLVGDNGNQSEEVWLVGDNGNQSEKVWLSGDGVATNQRRAG